MLRRTTVFAGVLIAILVLAGCGGGDEPTPTVAPTVAPPPTATATPAPPPTATPAPAEQVVAPDSPLAQPASPLEQPASPLALPGPEQIVIAVPADFNAISQVAAETKPPTPQPGKASLSGVLYSYGLNRIIPETAFYIAPAMEDNGKYLVPPLIFGPRPEKGDVAGTSTKKGQIFLDDIPPGHYYMYIWTVYNWPMGFESKEAERPTLIEVKEGDQLDLGLVYVEWP